MKTDIVIAGGGLNGCALSIALASAGLGVVVVDPAQGRRPADFDGRSYALSQGSTNLLTALGLWPELSAEAQPIREIKVSDGRAGEGPSPLILEFDQAEISGGAMGHMVEDRHLRPALSDAMGDVVHMPDLTVTAHTPGPAGVDVGLSDGTTITAKVLVGCDGGGSPTARRAGIDRISWRYGQSAMVCAVAHEAPHEGVAHQFFMPEGPLAILPLRGNRVSIVWTDLASRAAALNALPEDAYLNVLRPRFGDFLGDIRLDGARYTYPLSLSLAKTTVAERVALVGDAAHVVHPIAGQGLNAGLKDVAALAEVLVAATRRGEDPGAATVLGRYATWRRADTLQLALATDGFNRLFSNDNPLLRGVRTLGLGMVNAIGPMRRGFIREAAGLTGDRPRLLQGLAI